MHHAFVVEAEVEKGIETVLGWIKVELGMVAAGNPDVIVLRYGLLSVEDARKVTEVAAGAPFVGEHKAIIIAASRVYHEAQNSLLKLFEEPPPNTYLFFILPSLGALLPTLRSRVSVLNSDKRSASVIGEEAEAFIKATTEKRSAIIKKLTSGTDEEDRRENREEAIAIVNGVEAAAYAALKKSPSESVVALLSDTATLRSNLYDRSAPVRMILEHLSLVIPKNLIS